ncbi:MAG: hypothetical protein ACYDCC_04805 [Actinomycetota bacterium]
MIPLFEGPDAATTDTDTLYVQNAAGTGPIATIYARAVGRIQVLEYDINVKSARFGAKGDGVQSTPGSGSDDTGAFTAAISALPASVANDNVVRHSRFIIPQGIYNLTAADLFFPDNTLIVGSNAGRGETENTGQQSTLMTGASHSIYAKNNVEFRGVNFENYDGTGIQLLLWDWTNRSPGFGSDSAAGSIVISGCTFQGGTNAIQHIGFGDLVVEKCFFTHQNGKSVVLGGKTIVGDTPITMRNITFRDNVCNMTAGGSPAPTSTGFLESLCSIAQFNFEDNRLFNYTNSGTLLLKLLWTLGGAIRGNTLSPIGGSADATSFAIQVGVTTQNSFLNIEDNTFDAGQAINGIHLVDSKIKGNNPAIPTNVGTWITLDSSSIRNDIDLAKQPFSILGNNKVSWADDFTAERIGPPTSTPSNWAHAVRNSNNASNGILVEAGSNASQTSLEVRTDAGVSLFRVVSDGFVDYGQAGVALGGGAAATLATIGGSGPTGSTQSGWLQIRVGGAIRFIPVWT